MPDSPVSANGCSAREEITNALTHGVAAVAAVVGAIMLLVRGAGRLSTAELAAVAVYGASLVTLFLASTLYHAISHARAKDLLKRFDHGAIYLLIAGTYTPFLAITLDSTASHVLLAVVWPLALAGVVFKIFFVHRFRWLSLGSYLAMGWLALLVIGELFSALPEEGFALLLAGGLCFTFGTVFFAMETVRYTHAVWHLWVVAGAALHAVSIGAYVIPA